MNRRAFIGATASGLAVSTLSGFRRGELPTDSGGTREHALGRSHMSSMVSGAGPHCSCTAFPLNSFQWRGAIDKLSAHRRCIAPDFLALGYTEGRKKGRELPLRIRPAMLVETTRLSFDFRR